MKNERLNSAILEVKCPGCDGLCRDASEDDGVCGLCKGTGTIPTPIGQRILNLVGRNLAPSSPALTQR